MSQGIVPPAAISTPSLSADQTWTGVQTFSKPLFAGPDPWFDVKHPNFGGGAKGDGTTNDTAAIQAAITAAAAVWGTVWFPPGTYKFTSQLVAQNVRLIGAGVGATQLSCTASLGSGVPAIVLSSTKGGDAARSASCSGFRLVGPGVYSLGTKTASCDGIRVDGQQLLFDLSVIQFDSGIVLNSGGGHITLRSVIAQNNYYGVYQLNETADYYLDDCNLTGNSFASIGIPGTATYSLGGWQTNTMIRCHLGFSPYGIYQESGTADLFIYNSSFYDVRFEACGNGAIYTENYATASKGQFLGNRFDVPYGYFDTGSYRIGGRAHDYFAVVGYAGSTNSFDFGNWPWPSGAVGWLYVNQNYGSWFITGGPPPTPAPTIGSGLSNLFTYYNQDVVLAATTITIKGPVTTTASAAVAGSGFNVPHGVAPNTPVNGDIWTTSAGMFVRINGVTKTVTLT